MFRLSLVSIFRFLTKSREKDSLSDFQLNFYLIFIIILTFCTLYFRSKQGRTPFRYLRVIFGNVTLEKFSIFHKVPLWFLLLSVMEAFLSPKGSYFRFFGTVHLLAKFVILRTCCGFRFQMFLVRKKAKQAISKSVIVK